MHQHGEHHLLLYLCIKLCICRLSCGQLHELLEKKALPPPVSMVTVHCLAGLQAPSICNNREHQRFLNRSVENPIADSGVSKYHSHAC